MTRAAKLFILTLLLLMANVSTVLALPPLPASFYGTVQINGANAPAGAIVSAWINGVQVAQTPVALYNNQTVFSLDVPGDDPATPSLIEGGNPGDTVVFRINNWTASPTGVWNSGVNTAINLVENNAPVAANDSYATPSTTSLKINSTEGVLKMTPI